MIPLGMTTMSGFVPRSRYRSGRGLEIRWGIHRTVTNAEFTAFLEDATKEIAEDLEWTEDEDHSPSVEFRAVLSSAAGHPLFVRGSFNRLARTLSFVVIHRSVGRIYGLDLGKPHRNPSREWVGETHKHTWTEEFRDKEAYEPPDITASVNDPVSVWGQFCEEARITHSGRMVPPPPVQEELF
jgi:hypothetical protein